MRPNHIAVSAAAVPLLAALTATTLCSQQPAQVLPDQAESRGFPRDLIPISGGKVTLGNSAKKLLEVSKSFHPRSPSRRKELLRKLMSELGETTVTVEPFYLNRIPVTNAQYLKFIEATKGKYRFPFHWWRFGKPDDWKAKQKEVHEAFKGQKHADILYWERYWRDLKYAIPEGEEDLPVTFVSWIDAQDFAGWAGMRLPTEAEWLFAASKGVKQDFLWGDGDWDSDRLKMLKLARTRDKQLKPVGALAEKARGAFGNDDMVGNVWEWVSDVGYFPVAGLDVYKQELAKLRKNDVVKDILEPEWSGAKRVLKGGSVFSWSHPEEFRLDTRAYMSVDQTVEGAGFRVAKSSIPARDMCRSRIAVEYDSSFFGDREPNLDEQVGVERYDLSDDGRMILNYHAVAMLPVTHLALDGRTSTTKAANAAQERPMLFGTLITTEATESPALQPGIYTVYFRPRGMPRELTDALKRGNRELMAQRAAAAKGIDTTKSDKKSSKKKNGKDWRSILAKYGITEDEAAEKGAPGKIDFIRLKPGDLQVSTETHMLIFRGNDGNFSSAMPVTKPLATGSAKQSSLTESTEKDKPLLQFTLAVPKNEKARGSRFVFEVNLRLSEAASVSRPWRTPTSLLNKK